MMTEMGELSIKLVGKQQDITAKQTLFLLMVAYLNMFSSHFQ